MAKIGGEGHRVTITLDSSATGWRGTLLVAAAQRDPVPITTTQVSGDSVSLVLPPSVGGALLRGARSADRSRLDGVVLVQGETGAFRLVRAGSPEVARILAAAGIGAAPKFGGPRGRPAQSDPDSARLVTSDIALFWKALEVAPPDSLEPVLLREYLDKASVGVQDFMQGRIISAGALAHQVQRQRARYDSVRPNMLRISEAEPRIREIFRSFKSLYPEAKFPDVYFVVGRFNSGGTASPNGLLIGAEMIRDVKGLPALVAHELIHFQQSRSGKRTLLAQSFDEGAADFLGLLLSGGNINSSKHVYGIAHERELWREFRQQMNGSEMGEWMYRTPSNGRPNDLGYFIGFRIAEAYYGRASDKRAAIREIVQAPDVEALLRKSGYDP